MIDLTPEGLRARARDWCVANLNPFSEWTIDELATAFTALVAEARQESAGFEWCLDEIKNTLAGLGCSHGHEHAKTPPMMYPEWIVCVVAHRVAEARRAQREADALAVCWFCRTARPFLDDGNTRHVGQDAQGDLIDIHCVAAAIRAQEETP